MKHYLIKLIIPLLLILQLFSCSENSIYDKNDDLYLEKNIKRSVSQIEISSTELPSHPSIFQPHRIKILRNGEYFILADDSDKSLVLMNRQGEIVSKVGGEGRGPQEFESIIQIHVGCDEKIYILDMILFRITVFELVDDKLEYHDMFNFKNPSQHSLQSIYVTETGNYGVYNQTEGFQTSENAFLLYRLDNEFKPVKLLLKMPGNVRKKTVGADYTLYTPHEFLSRTFWDLDQNNFYYITTFHSQIYKYNLRSEKLDSLSYLQLPERLKTENHVRFFKERFSLREYKDYWSFIEEQDKLPLYSGLWVQDGIIFLRIFYPIYDFGIMIYLDQELDEMKYFQVPHELGQLSIKESEIYGINFRHNHPSELLFIDLGFSN